MKRLLLLLAALSLLFCACERENKAATVNTVANAVLDTLENADALSLADEDFIESNFLFEDEIEDAKIYLGEDREIGIIKLDDGINKELATRGIQEYLANETNSISSLITLYPSDALSERLLRYQNATVVQKGQYIGYFILPSNEAEMAKSAFLKALS